MVLMCAGDNLCGRCCDEILVVTVDCIHCSETVLAFDHVHRQSVTPRHFCSLSVCATPVLFSENVDFNWFGGECFVELFSISAKYGCTYW